MYRVKLNGQELTVYSTRVSAFPFNKLFDGKQRDLSQSETAYYVTADIDTSAILEIAMETEFLEYELRPFAKNIVSQREGNTILLTVVPSMQVVLEIDGKHNALHIFINPISKAPNDKQVIYYDKGEHYAGLICLESHQTLYLEEGAHVYGAVYAKDAEDIKICGRGVLDASPYRRNDDIEADGHELQEELKRRFGFAETDARYLGNLTLYNCKNVFVEGVILEDAPLWSLTVRNGCDDITIDNVKVIGQWRYNSDGIDICASRNVTVKNCFVRSFDDCIIARAAYLEGEDEPLENMTVENCVLMCDWGKNLEIWCGWVPTSVRNVSFTDCYLTRMTHIAMSIATWFGSEQTLVENILYKNIYIDEDKSYEPPLYETAVQEVYDKKTASAFRPTLVHITAEKLGKPAPRGSQLVEAEMDTSNFDIKYRNIVFDGIYKPQGLDKIHIKENTEFFKTENIIFK